MHIKAEPNQQIESGAEQNRGERNQIRRSEHNRAEQNQISRADRSLMTQSNAGPSRAEPKQRIDAKQHKAEQNN
jgi:hypothetical protein